MCLTALSTLVVSCGGGGPDRVTTPAANGPPSATQPLPTVPPDLAEPTPHPCAPDMPGSASPRETWTPIDCACVQPWIYYSVDLGEPVPTEPPQSGPDLVVESPRAGDEVASPLVVSGVVGSSSGWVHVTSPAGDGHYRLGKDGTRTPFELSLPFEVDEPGVACIRVGSGAVEAAIPVYVRPS